MWERVDCTALGAIPCRPAQWDGGPCRLLDLGDNSQLVLSFASYLCGPRSEPPQRFIDVTSETVNVAKKGVIPVLIFGTETFEVTTLAFGPAGAAPVHAGGHVEDTSEDGPDDLVTHCLASETADTEAVSRKSFSAGRRSAAATRSGR